MKYLGIDYGKRKVGLALSEGVYASSWKIITVSGLKDALTKMMQIIEAEKVDCVVIGKPESGEARTITLQFIKELKKALPKLSIIEKEETLSSQKALEQMIEMNVSKKARKSEDAYAAALILQEYLDSK
jgi:putative transcription antitermination factor YqgF